MSGFAAPNLDRLRAGERPCAQVDTPAAHRKFAAWRTTVTQALLADLKPGDHALVVWLLEREIDELTTVGNGDPETLYRLVAAVARFAHPEDALLIWRASRATAETRIGVDVEQVLRAGPEAVVRTLRQLTTDGAPQAEAAAAALAWAQAGIASGAASDLSAYFAWSDERFGLHISGPT